MRDILLKDIKELVCNAVCMMQLCRENILPKFDNLAKFKGRFACALVNVGRQN